MMAAGGKHDPQKTMVTPAQKVAGVVTEKVMVTEVVPNPWKTAETK